MAYILAILFGPFVAGYYGGLFHFLLNVIISIPTFYVGGVLHAVYLVHKSKQKEPQAS